MHCRTAVTSSCCAVLHHRRWHMQALVCCTRRDKSRKRLMASPCRFTAASWVTAHPFPALELLSRTPSSSGPRWGTALCISDQRSITEEHSMELVRKHLIDRKRRLAVISILVCATAALWGAAASAQVVTIEENTLGFCGVEGSVDSNHSGFTGSGFANGNNAAGSGVNWS